MNVSISTGSCRTLPFWAWNGRLDSGELRRQIRIFREMGYGGFFMHARTGLDTGYLCAEWFDAVRTCIDEARRTGLEAWLYDEDRYASGSGSGEIGRNRRFRRRTLEVERLETPRYRRNDLAWFAGELRGSVLRNCRRLQRGDELREGESFLRFHVRFDRANSWNNGGYYSDMMNAEGIRQFIRMTHERYARECGAEFGGVIPGLFSDEPNCSNWTEAMERKFAQRYGIDLFDHLPELFFEVEGESCSRIRYLMANLRTELLESAFAVQAAEWCRRHGLLYTGHVFGEENVITQTRNCGSAMRFVRHMDIPGVDLLSDHQLIYDAMLQTASVAHQNGGRRVLSESFAGTGWDYPLYAQKACMEWQLALGVTQFCSHLAFYTLRGEAKRDYPPSIHYQSPYFRVEKILQDHIASIGTLLGSGNPVRPILVVHPLESTWFWKPLTACTRADYESESRRLPRLRNMLLRAKLAFDYGDEAMLSEIGSVDGKNLRVGCASYVAAVVPELRTIRSTTLKLLEQFADAGGKVVYLGAAPGFVDALPHPDAGRIYQKFRPVTLAELPAALAAEQTVSVRDGNGNFVEPLLFNEVCGENGERRLFLCNTGCPLPLGSDMDAKSADERTLTIPRAFIRWKGDPARIPLELDPTTGTRRRVNAFFRNGWWEFETNFGRLESRLFATAGEEAAKAAEAPLPPAESVKILHHSSGPWFVQPDEPNVLVLDFAEYSFGGAVAGYGHVREADAAARRLLGEPERSHEMVQPWKQRQMRKSSRCVGATLRFRFDCREKPEKISLALEEADRYEIVLNGRPVEFRDSGFWCDASLRMTPLPPDALRMGENILELSCRYCGDMSGFEAVYLLGEFGVFENELTLPVRTVSPGDWGMQGYPYYSGNMNCSFEFEWNEPAGTPAFPWIPEWRGTAIGIAVNGGEPRIALLHPERLNLGKELKPGRNLIEITVYGSRRNSFGPFGADPGDMVDPSDFNYASPGARHLKPFGLLSEVRIATVVASPRRELKPPAPHRDESPRFQPLSE